MSDLPNAPAGEKKRETKVPGTFVSLFEKRLSAGHGEY